MPKNLQKSVMLCLYMEHNFLKLFTEQRRQLLLPNDIIIIIITFFILG